MHQIHRHLSESSEFMLIMWVGHLVGVVSDWVEHYSYLCYVTNTRRRCNWSNAKVGFFWKRSDHVQVDEMNSRSKNLHLRQTELKYRAYKQVKMFPSEAIFINQSLSP